MTSTETQIAGWLLLTAIVVLLGIAIARRHATRRSGREN